MYSKVKSGTLQGIDAVEVTVETDVSFGLPSLFIVGLPDAAIRESRERVRTAVINSGFSFPDKRVTVNLSPADLRKEGTHFDLPIAVGILEAAGEFKAGVSEKYAFIGELALDGKLNRIKGALSIIIALRDRGIKNIIIPAENSEEAALVSDVSLFAADNLGQVVSYLKNRSELRKIPYSQINKQKTCYANDFSEVAGHEAARRALQIAAAAMHNILMTGAPGAGKTMLARCLPSIMPDLTYEEQLELTKIYSIYGSERDSGMLVRNRPFRSPDHTVSPAALIGGGSRIKAGEATLAHLGILFLDELPEFSRAAIESLRKPMEDECCTISRVSGKIVLPSKFLTVAAMNPCPCGFFNDSRNVCRCSPGEISRYRAKLSGPFLDRIDITLNLTVPEFDEIKKSDRGTSSSELKEGVEKACSIQQKRYENEDINYNSQMNNSHIKKYCRLDEECERLMQDAFKSMNLSVRSYNKILKVARTIADLDGSSDIKIRHAAEAVLYKCEKEVFM